jgi:uncharacterized protein YceH (UPF0502 family)
MTFEPFNDIQLRIMGCLMEKAITTPDQYPLTVNSLRLACNQKTSRYPVVSYADAQLFRELNSLENSGIVKRAHISDSRVPKYEHHFNKVMQTTEKEAALLCVLMLRGPQTLGELRSRSQRLFDFSSLEEVERIIHRMENREEGALVEESPRQPGQKETRYQHCLGGTVLMPETSASYSSSSVSSTPPPSLADDPLFQELLKRIESLEEKVCVLMGSSKNCSGDD